VQVHEPSRRLERLFARGELHERITADDFLGFGERAVGDQQAPAFEPNAEAVFRRFQPGRVEDRAALRPQSAWGSKELGAPQHCTDPGQDAPDLRHGPADSQPPGGGRDLGIGLGHEHD
jgi:hypothetical protein